MKRTFVPAFLLFALLVIAAAHAANGVEKISWSQMPKIVQKLAHAHIVRHGKAQKSIEGDETFYDVEGIKNGKHIELSASADGKLLRLDQEVDLASVPEMVQNAVKKSYRSAQIGKIRKVKEDNDTSFVVDIVGAKTFSLQFDSDGELQSKSEDVTWAEIPLGAVKMLRLQIGTNEIESISKVTEGNEISFIVAFVKNDVEREVRVSAKGDLLEMEITLGEAPAAVQKTVRENLGSGKITEINRTSESGEFYYDLDLLKNGTDQFLSIAPDGTLISVEEEVSFSHIPENAQKAIQSRLNGRSLKTITKRVEDGETFYDVVPSKDETEFSVSENGESVEE